MNYKIIYFVGESFKDLTDFTKGCLLKVDGNISIIDYVSGQKRTLKNIQAIEEKELIDFGKLLKITTDNEVVYVAAVLISFKVGFAVGNNLKTTGMATMIKESCGLGDETVVRYGPYEVRKPKE